jgi:hypothetical protein
LSAVAITVPINYLIFKRLESSSNTPTNTIEMLDRHLLPENQLQSVERNIYSKLDTSRVAPSNENTPAGAVLIPASEVVLGKPPGPPVAPPLSGVCTLSPSILV